LARKSIGWRTRLVRVASGVSGLALLLPGAAAAQHVDASLHWPAPPERVEQLLSEAPFRILTVRGGVGGVMGVKKLDLYFPESEERLAAKWKAAPPGDADGWNNTPRKELAAYEIQKWFLEPTNYVVPTVTVRCIPFDGYAPLSRPPKATIRGTRCVAGALVVWIDRVTVPDVLYDEDRFRSEPHYAGHMADFNLLTYLIDHEDGREGNFLVSELESDRRIFSIDNGVAFGARVKNWFVPNWNRIRVPALREETVERLRRVGPDGLAALGVLAELRADAEGVLRPAPRSRNAAPKRGARVEDGWLQLGLTAGEIRAVGRRLERLLEDVDSGRISTF
jgi:hypothetical protein